MIGLNPGGQSSLTALCRRVELVCVQSKEVAQHVPIFCEDVIFVDGP